MNLPNEDKLMKKSRSLDAINRNILKILSLYEHLDLLELWFEMGEDGALETVTKQEVSNRLYSLMAKGFVERIDFGNGNIRWALKEVAHQLNGIPERGRKG
jgi:DNA-binding Lrp family transcriptional regulator